MHDFDIIVVGAGPAGLAFARALEGSGLDIALVERQPADVLASPPVAFAMADANDDGVLTAAERDAAKARLQDMRSARR